MLLVSTFHLEHPVDDDVLFSQTNFYFFRLFTVLSVRRASGSYRFLLYQDVFQTIFHIFRWLVAVAFGWFCAYRCYLSMSLISSYPAALQRCQLGFSRTVPVPGLASISTLQLLCSC